MKLLSLLLFLILPLNLFAFSSPSQLKVSLGMINGSFSGAETDSFSVSQGLSVSYELYRKPKKSYFIKAMLAMDAETGKARYSYSGVGASYYFNSNGAALNVQEKNFTYSIRPKRRYYYGWDFGISHMIVKNFGSTLAASANMIDFGGHIGTIFQMSKNWGLDVQAGMRFGYSFSSIAVTGNFMNFLVGGSYYF